MHGFLDRVGSASSSRITLPTMLPSAGAKNVGTPDDLNFAALSPRLRVLSSPAEYWTTYAG
jgi:hypothetical protein